MPVCKGLAKLVIVDIALSRDQDNPQLIFESLNSTGRELSQADLIRNFILMGLEPQLQTRLYEQYWRPMEVDFGQEAYATHFDGFMRHYLTVKTGEIPNVREVYEAFKQYARIARSGAGVEALVADIRAFAGYYCAMALGRGAGRGPEGGIPRPPRTEGGRRVPLPAGALSRLRDGSCWPRTICCRRCGWSRATCSAVPSAPSRRIR